MSRLLLAWLVTAGVCLFVSPLAAQSTASAGSAVPATGLPSPTLFAPAPFALPGSSQAAQKQLCAMLRRLDVIAAAEALITGGADSTGAAAAPLGLKLVLKARPGHSFTPELVTTVACLAEDAVAGLSPNALLVTDAAGTVLYAQGHVQVAATPAPWTPAPWLWLVGAVVLAAVAALLTNLRSRRHGTAEWWERLSRRQQNALLQVLADERPEIVAVVLGRLEAPLGSRLHRQLARRQIEVSQTVRPVDSQVAQVVMQAVRTRLEQQAL